jgi:hypothetical protein
MRSRKRMTLDFAVSKPESKYETRSANKKTYVREFEKANSRYKDATFRPKINQKSKDLASMKSPPLSSNYSSRSLSVH